jgi:hypothetical protein
LFILHSSYTFLVSQSSCVECHPKSRNPASFAVHVCALRIALASRLLILSTFSSILLFRPFDCQNSVPYRKELSTHILAMVDLCVAFIPLCFRKCHCTILWAIFVFSSCICRCLSVLHSLWAVNLK